MGQAESIAAQQATTPASPPRPAAAAAAPASPPRPAAAAATPARATNPAATPCSDATPAPKDNSWLQIYSPTRTPQLNRFSSRDFVLENKLLGEGSFARVQLATHLETNKKVAVKVIDKTRIPDAMRMYAAREPGILRDLKHPNVVKLLHTEETRTEIQIYLQFMEGCDMHTYVQENRRLEERDARRLFVQILDAVEYIHSVRPTYHSYCSLLVVSHSLAHSPTHSHNRKMSATVTSSSRTSSSPRPEGVGRIERW